MSETPRGRLRGTVQPGALLLGCGLVLALSACGSAESEDGASWVDSIDAPQYVAVRVGDIDRAIDWYRAAFGVDSLDDLRADDGAWRIVNLKNERLLVELIRDDRDTLVARPRGFAKVGFQVPDVEIVAERVARATGERPRIVDDERHRMRIVQLRDPEGNVIQLSSPLGRR